MARNATSQNIEDLRDALEPYAQAVTSTVAAVATLYQAQASMRLNVYLDAVFAFMNVVASAASSYSSAIGSSVQKRKEDDAKATMDACWAEFVEICATGGVTVPSLDESVTYWDQST